MYLVQIQCLCQYICMPHLFPTWPITRTAHFEYPWIVFAFSDHRGEEFCLFVFLISNVIVRVFMGGLHWIVWWYFQDWLLEVTPGQNSILLGIFNKFHGNFFVCSLVTVWFEQTWEGFEVQPMSCSDYHWIGLTWCWLTAFLTSQTVYAIGILCLSIHSLYPFVELQTTLPF